MTLELVPPTPLRSLQPPPRPIGLFLYDYDPGEWGPNPHHQPPKTVSSGIEDVEGGVDGKASSVEGFFQVGNIDLKVYDEDGATQAPPTGAAVEFQKVTDTDNFDPQCPSNLVQSGVTTDLFATFFKGPPPKLFKHPGSRSALRSSSGVFRGAEGWFEGHKSASALYWLSGIIITTTPCKGGIEGVYDPPPLKNQGQVGTHPLHTRVLQQLFMTADHRRHYLRKPSNTRGVTEKQDCVCVGQWESSGYGRVKLRRSIGFNVMATFAPSRDSGHALSFSKARSGLGRAPERPVLCSWGRDITTKKSAKKQKDEGGAGVVGAASKQSKKALKESQRYSVDTTGEVALLPH
ncbi:hypothetical protein BDN72DRAFT_864210 [Pluteus cervinus]|uniref:Uncharacterized protein n=1 Tax=Pluteus cervinus TaxID=181527 RepID=A0ACD3A481_9AGAR|nr:hypothetical protein BDN72DRAFT_864210 [Pluteus cervinus]